jgi:hypothetical protein
MLTPCVLLALCLLLATGPQSVERPLDADTITIDGSKDPQKLPNWVVWEHGFTVLGLVAGKDSGFNHDLRAVMTPDEFALLEREAKAQKDREAEAARAIEVLRPEWDHADQTDPKVIAYVERRTREINLNYRRAILDARDRVLAGLGVVAQSALMTWMNDERASIHAMVSKRGFADWRAPE